MYPAAPHKILTHFFDSSQVLSKCIRQKQPQIIKSISKNWDKNTTTDLEQVCPKQVHDLLSTFWSSQTNLYKLMLLVWSGIQYWKFKIPGMKAVEKKCRVERIKLVINTITIHTYKIYKFKCCIAQCPYTFAFLSAQSGLVLCRKR